MDKHTPIRLVDSRRAHHIQEPIIPYIGSLVRQNPDCISFGQGIAYYDPPRQAFEAVAAHIKEHSINLYGPVEGLSALRDALAVKLKLYNGIQVDPHYAIVVTAGSNMAFSSLMTAVADVGDEIILPSPYYFNHEMAIRMTDCVPVFVPTQTDYHLDLDAIEEAIGPLTRAIVTVSPNNPTGAVYSREELVAVNALCERYGIYHISDEAYEDFTYDSHRHFSPASLNGAHDHSISLYSFSKSYGFAGWRIGYIVLPTALFSSYKKIQDTVLISPTVISQYAAIGALQAGRDFISEKIARLNNTREQIINAFSKTDGLIECAAGEGAFYTFLKVHTALDDLTLARRLILEHQVAVIPGSTFGCADGCYLRLSYGAVNAAVLETGLTRLLNGLHALCNDSPAV